ncbi:MAG TPA: LysR family transcriptional regulator [Candidatus Rubneribacter avistercoris]|nr:LysR family transcriptional regulator [Candidatus Rubneribacter avistercoris]
MIETRLLRYFLAVAREQSITRAAAALHVTQPTLSKQMMDLERQLGVQLLVRGKKQVTLTDEGTYLRARAQEMIDLMERTEAALRSEEGTLGGDVYLGCGETRVMEFVADVFARLRAGFPEMRLHLHSGDAEEVMKRLDEGLLDFGLLLGPLHRDKYDYLDLGMRDTYGLLMPADCPLAERGSVTLDDLKQVPLIFPNQPYSGHQRLDWFGADFDALHIVATYNLLTNATFLVERGLGYAFCIDGLVDARNARGLAFRPVEPALTLDACIAAKRHRTLSPAAKLFLERLRKEVGR